MQCPVCHQRPARRRCPAKGVEICPVCCGTQRGVEIDCPPDCGYLATAQAHPPAAVRRQQERDLGFIMAMRDGLSESQSDLLWGLLGLVAAHRADPMFRLTDGDLAEGAGALAATYETAGRGVIYEHRPDSLVAQRLVTDLKAFFAEVSSKLEGSGISRLERDAALVLRHMETGARQARRFAEAGPGTALEIISRVVRAVTLAEAPTTDTAVEPPSQILIRP